MRPDLELMNISMRFSASDDRMSYFLESNGIGVSVSVTGPFTSGSIDKPLGAVAGLNFIVAGNDKSMFIVCLFFQTIPFTFSVSWIP